MRLFRTLPKQLFLIIATAVVTQYINLNADKWLDRVSRRVLWESILSDNLIKLDPAILGETRLISAKSKKSMKSARVYKVRIHNTGLRAVENLQLTLRLPPNVFLTASPTVKVSPDSQQSASECSLGNVSMSMRCRIAIMNTSDIASIEFVGFSDGDSDTFTVEFDKQPDLEILPMGAPPTHTLRRKMLSWFTYVLTIFAIVATVRSVWRKNAEPLPIEAGINPPPTEPEPLPAQAENQEGRKPNWLDLWVDDKYEDALKLIERDIADQSDTSDKYQLHISRAFILLELNRFPRAVDVLEKLVASHPAKEEALIDLISTWNRAGNPGKAVAAAEQYWATFPDSTNDTAVERYLTALINAGRHDEVIRKATYFYIAKRRVILRASFAGTILKSFNAIGRGDEIPNFLKELNKTHPLDRDVQSATGTYYYDKALYEQAFVAFDRLLKTHPTDEYALGMQGNIYLELGYSDKALELYSLGHKNHPDASWLVANSGNIYKNSKLYTRAKEYFEKALKSDPQSEYAHKRLAELIEKISQQEKDISARVATILTTHAGILGSDSNPTATGGA